MKRLIPYLFNVLFVGFIALIITMFSATNETETIPPESPFISNLYVFQNANAENIVLIVTLQGIVEGTDMTSMRFEPNSLIEFNIDNNNDHIEDLVIQALPKEDKVYFYGPTPPENTGKESRILEGSFAGVVEVSYGMDVPNITTTDSGVYIFAGLRDNPFFFDLERFNDILAEKETDFNNPGRDSFAKTNALSVVIELPKTLIQPPIDGKVNIWAEIKIKS